MSTSSHWKQTLKKCLPFWLTVLLTLILVELIGAVILLLYLARP